MSPQPGVPVLRQVVLDTTDVRALAEFYRQLPDLTYRPGDEYPGAAAADRRGQDWVVLRQRDGSTALAFQQVEHQPPATWPVGPHPQMLHLDLTVPTTAELDAAHQRALALGAQVLMDSSDDDEEPLWVYADPAGHPVCIFVAPAAGS
jgi:Glyoxalase-like domain